VKRYAVAPEADVDLRQIWLYLFDEAGSAIADRIQNELVDAFEGLADFPGKGHRRSDLTLKNVPFFSVHQYLIVYRRANLLEILAVLHGKRDLVRLLKSRILF